MPTFDPITGEYILTEEDAMGSPLGAGAPRIGPFQDPAVAQVTGMVPGAVNPFMGLDPEPAPQAATPQEELAGMPTYSTPSAHPEVNARMQDLESFEDDIRESAALEAEAELPPGETTEEEDTEEGNTEAEGQGLVGLAGRASDAISQGAEAIDQRVMGAPGELVEGDQLSMPTATTPKDTVQGDIAKAQAQDQARLDAINANVQDPQFDTKQTDAKLRQLEELNKIDKDVAKFQREKAEEIYKAAEADVKSYHEYTEKLKGDMEAKIKEIEAMRVNPAQLFDNIGTAGTIGMALSAGVGQMLAMKHGTPNTALQIIDKAIERNINAQVQNIENQHKVVGLQRGLLEVAGDVIERKAMARKRATAQAYAFAEATAAEKIANLPETQQVKSFALVEELRNRRIKAQQDYMQRAEENAHKRAQLRIQQADAETRRMKEVAKLRGDERKRRLSSGGSGRGVPRGLQRYPGNTTGEKIENAVDAKREAYAKRYDMSMANTQAVRINHNIVKGRDVEDLILVSDKGNLALEGGEELNARVSGAAALLEIERILKQLEDPSIRDVIVNDKEQYAGLQASWEQATRAYTQAVGGYGAIGKDEQGNVNLITGRMGNDSVKALDFLLDNDKVSLSLEGVRGTRQVLLEKANEAIATMDSGVPPITEDQLNPVRMTGPLDKRRNTLAHAGLQEVTTSKITDAFEIARKEKPDLKLDGFEQGFNTIAGHVAKKVNPKAGGTVADHKSRLRSALGDLDNYRNIYGDEVFTTLGLDGAVADIESDINRIDRYYQIKSAMGSKVEEVRKEDFSEAIALEMGLKTYEDNFTVGDATLNRVISRTRGATERRTDIERVEPVRPPTKAAQKGVSKGKNAVKEGLGKIKSLTEWSKTRKKKNR